MEAENYWISQKVVAAKDILITLQSAKFNADIRNKVLRENNRKQALSFYNKNNMIDKYLDLFNSESLNDIS